MIRAAVRWPAGLISSLLLHGSAAFVLAALLTPNPRPSQPIKHSALTLEAYRVPRTEAAPQQPQGAETPTTATSGTNLAPSTPPQVQARPIRARPDRIEDRQTPEQLLPSSTPAAALTALPPQGATILAAQAHQADRITEAPTHASQLTSRLKKTAPHSAPLVEAPLPVQPATAAVAPSSQVAAISSPGADTAIKETMPTTATLAALPTVGTELPSERPELQPLPPAEPSTLYIAAALAFQGRDQDNLDPVSVAAFQNLMHLGEQTPEATTVKNALQQVLQGVPCSRLQVVFDPDRAVLDVRGHLPSDRDRGIILSALRAQMGADIAVSDQMRLLPEPQCGALAAIENIGLPQSTEQITNRRLVGPDAHSRVFDYTGGDWLFLELQAPDYPAFIYVDYFDADGNVIHLRPAPQEVLEETPAKAQFRVGVQSAEEPGLQIRIGPPYGQEIAVAFAASHPLFTKSRPLVEPAAPYLAILQQTTQEKRSQHIDFKGEWIYFLIHTHAAK